jgi:putrescine aminotransferase
MFACEAEAVTPDLMTLAKCLGGGVMPIGAVLGTAEIWDRVFGENPLMHTSTFGGNEMACAAALAALTVIEEEALVEKSRSSGKVFLEGLVSLAEKHPQLVLEARGRGLMLGLEFRFDEVGELVVAQLLIRQVIAAYTLNNPRVLRIEPPLMISADEIEFALGALDEALIATREMLLEFGILLPETAAQMSATFGAS